MFERSEGETEILLGNKQLLAIFFVGAVLLGAAFAGGYMVGRGAGVKKPAPMAALPETIPPDTSSAAAPQVGETHSVAPEETASLTSEEDLLGAPKKKTQAAPATQQDSFTPESGQEFLQVAAVPRDHAVAVASVLRKKGFRAHAVAKPGDASLYRVIVGPIRSAGELSSTRDSLRKTGFNRVLIQRY